MKRKPCMHCDGTGYLTFHGVKEPFKGEITVTCTFCFGRGYLLVTEKPTT